MIRASTGSPALACSRQYAAAWRIGANVPRRWTAMTASHSDGSMFTSMRSRRMPALLTSTSRRPKASTACATIAPASSKSATLPPLTTASPPAATISSTTDCAGEASSPTPLTSPPRSLTTTLAPWRASDSACSRPMPRPAPVTSATRPSHSPDMAVLSLSRVLELLAPRVPGVQLVPEGDVVLAVDPTQIDLAAVAQGGEVDQPAVEVAQDDPALRELGHAAAQLEERLP